MLHVRYKRALSMMLALFIALNLSGTLIKATAVFINGSGIAKTENTLNKQNNDANTTFNIPGSIVSLKSLVLSPGFVTQPFGSHIDRYNLTLSEKQTEFTIKATTQYPHVVSMEVIDDKGVVHPLANGATVGPFASPPVNTGSLFKIRLWDTQSGFERIIKIIPFTVGVSLDFDLKELVSFPDGSKQLRVDASVSPGYDIATVAYALKFDPTKIQLANATTNEVIRDKAKLIDTVSLYQKDRYGEYIWGDFAFTNGIVFGPELNRQGLIYGDYGIENISEPTFSVTEANKKFMTIHFRVIDEAFTDNVITLNPGIKAMDGVRISVYSRDKKDQTLYGASHRDMFKLSGLMYKLTTAIQTYDNGNIVLIPNKNQYAFGEKIKVTAKANRGYEFIEWDKTLIPPEMLSDATRADPQWHTKPTFELVMPKANAHVTIAMSTPAGFVKIGEAYDKTQATLDFTNAYQGEQIIVVADPYENNNSILAEVSNIIKKNSIDQDTQKNIENTISNTSDKVNTYTKALGEEKIFKAISNTTNGSYTDKNFILKSNGTDTNIWIDKTKELEYSDQEIAQMQEVFDKNYNIIKNKFGNIYDTDADGKLNILIYDIPGANSYFDLEELIGQSGNRTDVIHLSSLDHNVKTSVEMLSRNMAFQTQKISLITTFQSDFATLTKAKYDAMMPKWIESGLSMMAMKLTGSDMDDVITLFNTSEMVRNGEVSLTQWEETPENYALAYLFFSYITSHTNDDILKGFYKSYASLATSPTQTQINDAIKNNFMQVITKNKVFEGLNFKAFHENFRIATYINSETGVYGFNKNKDFDRLMAPISNKNLFNGTENRIKSGTAIVVETGTNNVQTTVENKVSLIGATLTKKTLTETLTPGGTVERFPDKTSYNKNEKVTLTAIPEPGYKLSHWNGPDMDGVTANTISTVMNKDKHYTAVFMLIPDYTISYAPDINGNVIIRDKNGVELTQTANAVKVREGEEITITADGVGQYYFNGWTGDYIGSKNEPKITIVATKDMHLIPEFKEGNIYSINYELEPKIKLQTAEFEAVVKDANGNIISKNPTRLLEGSILHLGNITLKEHWNFLKWNINGIEYFGEELAIEITENTNITLEVIETEKIRIKEPVKNYLKGMMTTEDTLGNVIIPDEEVYIGTDLKYTAIPAQGYSFLEWNVKTTKGSHAYSTSDLSQNPLVAGLVKGEEFTPVFIANGYIDETSPIIGSIDITTGVSKTRELVRTEGGRATTDRFDQSYPSYNLYLKSDDVNPRIKIGIYGIYDDVTMQINNEIPMKVTVDSGLLGYALAADADVIKVAVKGNIQNGNENETTEYIINVVRLDKTPTINIQYQLAKNTDYNLKVSVQDTALLAAQFTMALPGGTKFLGNDGTAYDMNISKDDFITYVLDNDVAPNFTISLITHQYDQVTDSEIFMIAFDKKLENFPTVYSGTPFRFAVRLPVGKDISSVSVLNDNINKSIISDYRFPVEELNYIYLIQKIATDVIIKVNSMNNRYNGKFDINKKYDINGFDISLLAKDGTAYKPRLLKNSKQDNARYTSEFRFEDVPEGTYDLYLNKYQHLKLIKSVSVGKVDGLLNDGYNPGYDSVENNTFYLIPGDINDDNYINVSDKNIVREVKYYGKKVSSFMDAKDRAEAIKRDINNDGYINISDYSLVIATFAYGKTTIKIN